MSRRHDPPERSTRAGSAAGLAAAGVCLAALAVYLRTLHTALPGPDSGELIAVARVSGIAHPPGYPLYTLLAHAFGAIVAAGRYAWRINMLSALLNAAAAGIVCAAVIRLTGRTAAGCAAGLALAFARPFWKTALVAEVFPLNSLMAALLWLAFVTLLRDAGLVGGGRPAGHAPRARPWPLALLLLITAAIPAHHHTLLLLALPLDAVAAALVLLPADTLARLLPGYRRP
ncbi:MAG TPA: DUF2723 domain-containing protein, partial [Candidatus Eisenbacteria bacterium]|nr:DUF2723 domain-containing protein [Candidatus Eisenbacteria bacterium]